jgi:hypothetical protein
VGAAARTALQQVPAPAPPRASLATCRRTLEPPERHRRAFGWQHGSATQYQQAVLHLEANRAQVEAWNAAPGASFKQRLNHFAHMSRDSFQALMLPNSRRPRVPRTPVGCCCCWAALPRAPCCWAPCSLCSAAGGLSHLRLAPAPPVRHAEHTKPAPGVQENGFAPLGTFQKRLGKLALPKHVDWRGSPAELGVKDQVWRISSALCGGPAAEPLAVLPALALIAQEVQQLRHLMGAGASAAMCSPEPPGPTPATPPCH